MADVCYWTLYRQLHHDSVWRTGNFHPVPPAWESHYVWKGLAHCDVSRLNSKLTLMTDIGCARHSVVMRCCLHSIVYIVVLRPLIRNSALVQDRLLLCHGSCSGLVVSDLLWNDVTMRSTQQDMGSHGARPMCKSTGGLRRYRHISCPHRLHPALSTTSSDLEAADE